MEDYNKIIESLKVRFIKASNINIVQSVTIENYYDVENKILIVNNGEIGFNGNEYVVNQDEILFIPGGKSLHITFGSNGKTTMSNDDFINKRDNFFQVYNNDGSDEDISNAFSSVNFEAKVFDTVSFFTSLDIPAFIIKDPNLAKIVRDILRESMSERPGSGRILKIKTEELVVEIIRYIIAKNLFVEKLATNITYFKDPRLIDIFTYIKENLGGDLSNKILANVANVSEDYVGQYFKMLTGINPQDYIEYQRMEMAVKLLRTSKKSIRNIAREVGYKDTAYFCRRFKMMFGIPAGKMRRRESLMNV